MDLKIIIVLYEKKFLECKSIQSLLRQKNIYRFSDISIEVYDNSLKACFSKEDLSVVRKKYKIFYHHTPENIPLSKIYSNAFKSDSADFILLLDDDTGLPCNYLVSFYEEVASSMAKDAVFVPRVKVFDKLISPYRSFFVFSKPLSVHKTNPHCELTAINSGIFIPKIFISMSFQYPSYATFYGTDTVLFEFINKEKMPIIVLDTVVEHELSFHPKSELNVYLNSMVKVKAFWRCHYGNSKLKILLLHIYFLYLSVKLTIKYRRLVNILSL